jgi:hypothetical protein
MVDFINIVSAIFNGTWSLMTQINVPLLGIKFSTLYLDIGIMILGLSVVRLLFGLGSGQGSKMLYELKNKKISKERKNDSK